MNEEEDWAEQHVVSISFTVHGARLHLGEAIEKPPSRSICMQLQVEPRKDVRLPDDRTLNDVYWEIWLIEA